MRIITGYQAAQAVLHQRTQCAIVTQWIQTGCRMADSKFFVVPDYNSVQHKGYETSDEYLWY